MTKCDRCVKNGGAMRLGLLRDGCSFAAYDLCESCLSTVLNDLQGNISNYRPPWLSEFCPSLTVMQAQQVEAYIASRLK